MNYLMLNYSYLLTECVLSECYVPEALFLQHCRQKKKKCAFEIMWAANCHRSITNSSGDLLIS